MKLPALAATLLLASAAPAVAAETPFEWLEAVDGARAMEWVQAENAKTLPVLTGDARYAGLHAEALTILSAKDRIPTSKFIGTGVYNFWQDAANVRGLWRRTTLGSFRSATPTWETVLDVDALAKAENANWIWKGSNCRPVTHDRCLVDLSNGGKDAVEVREFDLKTKAFVEGGFRLSESKQTVAWLDADTLILTRDWGPGTTTESGYGFVVKTLKRGQPLSEAKEVYRGSPKDVSVTPMVYRDAKGQRVVVLRRAVDFFHTEFLLLTDKGVEKTQIPQRSTIQGFVNGDLIVTLEESWTRPRFDKDKDPKVFASGTLISITPDKALGKPLTGPNGEIVISNNCDPCVVFEPNARQSIDQVEVTDNRVAAVVYDNVRGRLMTFQDRGEWGWRASTLPTADNASINLVSASDGGDQLFFTVESFVSPTQLSLGELVAGKLEVVKTMPARFKADDLTVEQFEATSKDGTKIPYFVIRKTNLKYDGSNPAQVFAYGGFQLSKLPLYDPINGKLWLERGGVQIVPNIRGGGEFGPAWHEAALKQNRQRAYDDLFAVAEDVVARKISSPRHMGFYGRSNGGLLAGVALTQRPDLWNAVVVESPLLDMLRYHLLPAGASWIGEYGDPTKPEEAAWIAKYSPFQNVKPGVKYPLAYITTSTKDDRVHPGHARKFAARLEEVGAPYLYYENTDGGHANAADPAANAKRWAMHYVYLSRQLMD
ncbi:prolyl oligopeptidase family serine peptidase [Caulobacter mirabilis]|uniref:S9 family peptidase n=1 Tax=Caulobacter mirabilis TaxID=69666 RepID=A0A2D2B2K3_9CAUL|nr:prolyl oligopeptidase family serine peptidase [Caulobacter mirabilis]ATQ44457.1 S9 family peptidase [Caulobacter mirabilis]